MEPFQRRTFRCITSYQVERASINLARGELGVITGASTDGQSFDISIRSRNPNVSMTAIPAVNLQIGPPYIADTHPLPVVLTGPLLGPTRPTPPGITTYQNDLHPFRRAVSWFLSGIWEHRARLPYLTQSQRNLLSSDQDIQETTNRFYENVHRDNPRFFQAIATSDFTIDDIIPTLQPTDRNDRRAGIYFAICDRFRKKTNLEGTPPRAYVGQSKGIGARIASHHATADGDAEGQEVHKAMRQAGRIRWFRLASHQEDKGVSQEAGKAMRDVMESTFMMIFGTMHERVMVSRIRNDNDAAKGIATNYDLQEMAKVFTDISRAAFGKAGISLPGSRSNRRPFGLNRYGCNVTIPLGGEYANFYEQILWVRQDLPGEQWAFHRSPLQFQKDKRVSTMTYSNHEGNLSLIIQPSEEEIKEMGIKFGDEYRAVWEVKKPGAGDHPVPFVHLCTIGPWSNWNYANKVAFKIMWRSRKDKSWKTRYLQRAARHRFVQNCAAPGALLDYSLGVGLFCYFTRSKFPTAQPWTADFGSARLVTYTMNCFDQQITVAHFAGSAAPGLKGPTYSADVPRVQMERLGLQNVNGRWRGFDWSWFTDPSKWKDGQVQTPKETRNYKRREKCDFCFLSAVSVHSTIHLETNTCIRIGDTNICEPCAKTGRPCSWTDLPTLFGAETWLEEVKTKKQIFHHGQLNKDAASALLNMPLSGNALKTFEIDDSSGRVITDLELHQQAEASFRRINRNDLSADDQGVYDLFDEKAQSIIKPMLKMQKGTPQYSTLMDELGTLVGRVATRDDISDMVRACLNYLIDRNIRPFMINGVIPKRGG